MACRGKVGGGSGGGGVGGAGERCVLWTELHEVHLSRYGTDKVYKGYFQAGLRHGFGILDSVPQAPQPFRYTGHWERGQRSGYGIEEDRDR